MSTDEPDTPGFDHRPVMVDEITDLFAPVPPGTVVDATLGGGGHSASLLRHHPQIDVLGIDQDAEALEAASATPGRVRSPGAHEPSPVRPTRRRARRPRRRRDQRRPVRPRRVVAAARPRRSRLLVPERRPARHADGRRSALVGGRRRQRLRRARTRRIIRRYGDERFAGRIARAIVAARPLQSTTELAEVVTTAIPAAGAAHRRTPGEADVPGDPHRGQRRTRRACRARSTRRSRPPAPGGRIAVLAYHSGEDRIVKERFAARRRGVRVPARSAVRVRSGADRPPGARRSQAPERRRARSEPSCRVGAAARGREDRSDRQRRPDGPLMSTAGTASRAEGDRPFDPARRSPRQQTVVQARSCPSCHDVGAGRRSSRALAWVGAVRRAPRRGRVPHPARRASAAYRPARARGDRTARAVRRTALRARRTAVAGPPRRGGRGDRAWSAATRASSSASTPEAVARRSPPREARLDDHDVDRRHRPAPAVPRRQGGHVGERRRSADDPADAGTHATARRSRRGSRRRSAEPQPRAPSRRDARPPRRQGTAVSDARIPDHGTAVAVEAHRRRAARQRSALGRRDPPAADDVPATLPARRRPQRSVGAAPPSAAPDRALASTRRATASASRRRRRKRTPRRAGSPRFRLIAALVVIVVLLLVIVARVAALQTTEAEALPRAGRRAVDPHVGRARTARHDLRSQRQRDGDLGPAATHLDQPEADRERPGARSRRSTTCSTCPTRRSPNCSPRSTAKERGFVYVARQVDAAVGEQISEPRAARRQRRSRGPAGDARRRDRPQRHRRDRHRRRRHRRARAAVRRPADAAPAARCRARSRPADRSIPGSETVTEAPVAGDDLVLTLDRSIQFSTEQVLLETVSASSAPAAPRRS